MDLGPHAAFIWSAYAVAGAVMLALIIWIVSDARHKRRRLEELEARGITRRSATPRRKRK